MAERKKSAYARKREAGIVPRRHSQRYAAWRSAIREGRDASEEDAAWVRNYPELVKRRALDAAARERKAA